MDENQNTDATTPEVETPVEGTPEATPEIAVDGVEVPAPAGDETPAA